MPLPSIWSLILPNLTGTTLLGAFLLLLGMLVGILSFIYLPLMLKKYGLYVSGAMIAIGLILLFVFSFFQDVFKSTELTIGFVGLVFLVTLGYFLFGKQKKKRKKK